VVNAILATNFDDLNNYIKEQKVIEVIVDDIQTQMETLQHIQETQNIDVIIISDMLRGSIGICDFIERVIRVKEERSRIYYLAKEYTPALKKILCSNKIRYFTPGTQTIEEFIDVIVKEVQGQEPQKQEPQKQEPQKQDPQKQDPGPELVYKEVKRRLIPEIKREIPEEKGFRNPAFELSRVICVMSAPSVHPGNSTIASNLAYLCSSDKKTALTDISPGAGQFYNYDIYLKKIKLKYEDIPGYNCLDTLKNAMHEDNIKLIPDLSYAVNSKLNIFTRDINSLKDEEFSGIFNFIDRIRTIYPACIVDTSGYGEGVREAAAIADTVLFIEDMSLSSVSKSLNFLEKIKGTVNMGKFILILNRFEESKEIKIEDIVKSHEERGIVFKDVLTIPCCNKACLESQYLRKHALELGTATEEFKKAFHDLYSNIFYSSAFTENKKLKVLGRFFG
jgi:hypothetical protein